MVIKACKTRIDRILDILGRLIRDKSFVTVRTTERRLIMIENSTYIIVELVGTSETSWEEATKNAVELAASRLKDIRIAEVVKLDTVIEEGKVKLYRARINLSAKYDPELQNPGLASYTALK